jgi:hypothetical protein
VVWGTVGDIREESDDPAGLRAEGLALLRRELTILRWGTAGGRYFPTWKAQGLLEHPSFRYVRHPLALGFIPPAEAAEWRMFWSDVRAFRATLAGRP